MQLGLAIAIALFVVAVVAWPLVMRRRQLPGAPPPYPSDDHRAGALNDVYEAIRTLQMDHSLGRIADADFREQLDEYRRQAARLLRDMDAAGQADPTSES